MKFIVKVFLGLVFFLGASHANAWWFFNEGVAASNAADAAKEAREEYFRRLEDPESSTKDIEEAAKKLRDAQQDAFNKIIIFGTSVPGTSLHPPPTPPGLLKDAVKEALDSQLHSFLNRELSDSELSSVYNKASIGLGSEYISLLTFDYATDPRTSPLFFAQTTFTVAINEGNPLVSGDALVNGFGVGSSTTLGGAIASFYQTQSPTWDPYGLLSRPADYKDFMLVEVTGFDLGTNTVSGSLLYGNVGLVSDVPEPSALAVMLAGLFVVGLHAGRRRQSFATRIGYIVATVSQPSA